MVTTWETHTPNNLPDSSPKMQSSKSTNHEHLHEGEPSTEPMQGLSPSDFSSEIQEEISSAMDVASLSLSALSADTDFHPPSHHDNYRSAPLPDSLLTDENKDSSEQSPLLHRRRGSSGYEAVEEV